MRTRLRESTVYQSAERFRSRFRRFGVPHPLEYRDRFQYRIHYGYARALLHREVAGEIENEIAVDFLQRAAAEARDVLSLAEAYTNDPVPSSELDRFVRRAIDATVVVYALAWYRLKLREQPYDAQIPWLISHPEHPDHLIGWYDTRPGGRSSLDQRVRYNIACYWAVRGDPKAENDHHLLRALSELANGLAPGEAKVARKDPSLFNLQHEKWKARFEAVLKPFDESGPDPVLALAKVTLIGKVFAERLAEHGIKTADDLGSRVRTWHSRAQVAEDVQAPLALIDAWAALLRLRLLRGIAPLDLASAELLYDAGLRAPQDLRGMDARVLAEHLRALNDAKKLLEVPPDEATVHAWIRAES